MDTNDPNAPQGFMPGAPEPLPPEDRDTPGVTFDAETGEVIRPQPEPVQEHSAQPAAETVIEHAPQPEIPPQPAAPPPPPQQPRASEHRAADGHIVPGVAMTAGQTLDLLSDGAISHEAYLEITELMAKLSDINEATGQKVKGKVTITLDFEKDGQFFTVGTDIKVVAPKEKRPRSVLWSDENNRPSRFQPNQYQMLGVRSVGGGGPIRQ